MTSRLPRLSNELLGLGSLFRFRFFLELSTHPLFEFGRATAEVAHQAWKSRTSKQQQENHKEQKELGRIKIKHEFLVARIGKEGTVYHKRRKLVDLPPNSGGVAGTDSFSFHSIASTSSVQCPLASQRAINGDEIAQLPSIRCNR